MYYIIQYLYLHVNQRLNPLIIDTTQLLNEVSIYDFYLWQTTLVRYKKIIFEFKTFQGCLNLLSVKSETNYVTF